MLPVLRELRSRNLNVTLSFCTETKHYVIDPVEDFAHCGSLVDFSKLWWTEQVDALTNEIEKREVGLILQIGAAALYRHLPFIKEKLPGIVIVDLLYNDRGHVVQHFLFEQAFDAVLVESEYMQQYVERCSAKPDLNVQIVKSGISLEFFTPPVEQNAQEGLRIGYVGRMSDEKNPLGFVALAEEIYTALPDTRFWMSGGGGLESEVRERIESSVARCAFHYGGHTDDPRTILRQLDALIVPSRTDGRPNAIMEANACGVPVIAAPVGGIPEMVQVGVNGYLFPPTAIASVVNVISRWRNDAQSLAAIKSSSRKFAEQSFDKKSMLDGYEQAFVELLDSAGLPVRSVPAGAGSS